jgi:hypothetical protein
VTSRADVQLELAGEPVRLLPERALFWQAACALVVADVHWGKAAAFRSAGIPIPGGATRQDLDRLDQAVARTGARRLVVLGDLFHAKDETYFKDVWYWNTPSTTCLDGRTDVQCTDFDAWTKVWTEVTGG